MIQNISGGCFLPEAPIMLSDGSTKIIKDLKDGDFITTFNTKTSTLEACKISSLNVFKASYLCEISLGSQKVFCTPNHSLWVPDQKEWRAVWPHPDSNLNVLKVGDSLLFSDKKNLKVESIRIISYGTPIDVYSMHVESTNCFFAYGVLAHNMQLFVKKQGGGESIKIDIEPNYTIAKIKEIIKQETRLPPEAQTLRFAGKVLEDSKTLADYNIQKDTTLFLGSLDSEPKAEFTLTIYFDQTAYNFAANSKLCIRDLKTLISKVLNLEENEFVLLYGGQLLLHEKNTISSYKINSDANIIVIPSSKGGDSLWFMQMINEAEILDLRSCLKHLDQNKLDYLITDASTHLKISNTNDRFKFEADLAVMLWTSNILYKEINERLGNNRDLSEWASYLKLLVNGLKQASFYGGKAYKVVRPPHNLDIYQKGKKIIWKTISGLSKNQAIAKNFNSPIEVVFEVQVVSGRDISRISLCPDEDIILLPYTCFEVMDIVQSDGKPLWIYLREIPIPRGPKVLFWVDDKPMSHYKVAERLEQQFDLSCVLYSNTKDVLEVIENYRWLLYFGKSDFKIVTDMVRYENGVPNYTAGIDLLEALFNKYKYNFEVLVFCNDVEKAKENCKQRKIDGRYIISKEAKDFAQFVKSFK